MGGGQFGDVYRGIWQKSTVVALKKPKSQEGLEEVENESAVLRYFSYSYFILIFYQGSFSCQCRSGNLKNIFEISLKFHSFLEYMLTIMEANIW